MKTLHFCTYCNRGYAARLWCLHESLRAQGEAFCLHVLCFDEATRRLVESWGTESARALTLEEVMAANPDYAACREKRTAAEFFFTTTPVLIRHCLERFPEVDKIAYLDADLWFFGPASAVWAEQGDGAVGIVPHRFPPQLRERERYGIYNVAWVSFVRGLEGEACLAWWRERCLEWCHDRVEGEWFADQGYLNEFPRRFAGVRVLDHPGINAAPWNMAGKTVGGDEEGRVTVEGRPLWFYHFQGVSEVADGWYEPGLRQYGTPWTAGLKEAIYAPYLRELRRREAAVRGLAGGEERRVVRHNAGGSLRERWERFKARAVLPITGRWSGRLVYAGEVDR